MGIQPSNSFVPGHALERPKRLKSDFCEKFVKCVRFILKMGPRGFRDYAAFVPKNKTLFCHQHFLDIEINRILM